MTDPASSNTLTKIAVGFSAVIGLLILIFVIAATVHQLSDNGALGQPGHLASTIEARS